MITYTDQAQLVDELRHYFGDVPLVMRAADMIEALFNENEELHSKVDEQGGEITRLIDVLDDIKRVLEKVVT